VEYRANADANPDHYMVLRVTKMRQMAPGLRKYLELKAIVRE
jgi:hypothetical protein